MSFKHIMAARFQISNLFKKPERLLLGLILIIAVCLRLTAIIERDLHMDEALYARCGGEIAVNGNLLLRKVWIERPPLFFYISSIFFLMFGFSQQVAYITNFLTSTLSLIVVYSLTKNLSNERTALIAAVFVALSPLDIAYAVSAFVDTLTALFLVLSIWMITKKRVLLSGLFFGAAVATKQIAPMFLPLTGAFLIVLAMNQKEVWKYRVKLFFRNLLVWFTPVVTLLFPILLWSNYIQVPWMGSFSVRRKDALQINLAGTIEKLQSWLRVLERFLCDSNILVILYVCILFPAMILEWKGFLSDRNSVRLQRMAIHLFVLFYFAVFSISTIPTWNRYLVVLMPFLFISFALAIWTLAMMSSSRLIDSLWPVMTVFLIILFAYRPISNIPKFTTHGGVPPRYSKVVNAVEISIPKQKRLTPIVVDYDNRRASWQLHFYFFNSIIRYRPLTAEPGIKAYKKELRKSLYDHIYVSTYKGTKIDSLLQGGKLEYTIIRGTEPIKVIYFPGKTTRRDRRLKLNQ